MNKLKRDIQSFLAYDEKRRFDSQSMKMKKSRKSEAKLANTFRVQKQFILLLFI
jgi:hypothetical protein